MSNVFTIVQAERNETASQEKAEKERYRKKKLDIQESNECRFFI